MFGLISRCKPVFLGMAILCFFMAFPVDPIWAAIVATDSSTAAGDAGRLRVRMLNLLAREEFRGLLLQHGITAGEAEARVNALTDEEAIRISNSIDRIVVGGNRSNAENHPALITQTELLIYLGALVVGILLGICVQIVKHYLNPPKIPASRASTSIPGGSPSDQGQTEPVPPVPPASQTE